MRRLLIAAFATLSLAAPVCAQNWKSPESLFAHVAGRWVLRGTIAGQPTTHDVDAAFVLNGEYIQLHEVSREKDATGRPQYEAIVLFAVDTITGAHAALWLDNTGTALFPPAGVGRGTPVGDSIPFIFHASNGDVFHNTFVYSRRDDSWQWIMDGESGGKWTPFARVTLTKQPER